jgi:hypothetical protein
MENLHIIATDKPSRLFKVSDELKLTRKFDLYNGAIYQNIYITNNEEIIEGDWIYYTLASGYCKTTVSSKGLRQKGIPAKKITLTTDQDLIKDGVQEIDDEFLQWFVKNPSCEEVDVFKEKQHIGEEVDESYPKGFFDYKIIIPKEEQKELRRKLFTLIKSLEQEEPKQERLEEAALRLYPRLINDSYNPMEDDNEEDRNIWIKGAKWQQEQDKKCYHPMTERKHTSDVHFECTICGYNNY